VALHRFTPEQRLGPVFNAALCASTSPYLHDGSASTIEAAVLAHDGEATASRTAFEALPASDQGRLLEWLGTR
jgi:CxxC motif-containing protein (DUF1111 family)